MKRIVVLLGLVLVGTISASAHTRASVQISFGVFYNSLGHHGEWMSIDRGVYAWRPTGVDARWRPYLYGYWVWTVDGWYWVSDEPWSWAVYHYGRWHYDEEYGWLWIPGYEWAPAWVEWRYGGDHIGWAPLGPYAIFSIHVGIHYSRRWITPYHYWSFVHCQYLAHHNIHHYVYRPETNQRYVRNTRRIGNVRYSNGRVITPGPEREYVERRGKVRIERVELVDATERTRDRVQRSEDGSRLEVYRPRVDEKFAERERPERIRKPEKEIRIDTRESDIRRRVDRQETVGRERRDDNRNEKSGRDRDSRERKSEFPPERERDIAPDSPRGPAIEREKPRGEVKRGDQEVRRRGAEERVQSPPARERQREEPRERSRSQSRERTETPRKGRP
jgi:hypothetical protein